MAMAVSINAKKTHRKSPGRGQLSGSHFTTNYYLMPFLLDTCVSECEQQNAQNTCCAGRLESNLLGYFVASGSRSGALANRKGGFEAQTQEKLSFIIVHATAAIQMCAPQHFNLIKLLAK